MAADCERERPLEHLVAKALAEDVGARDLTTELVVSPGARAHARIAQKHAGVICGLEVAEAVFSHLDPSAEFAPRVTEGLWREGGPVCEVFGLASAILTAERVALNFLAHMSAVATLTARFVAAVEGTGVAILDTRKTTPTLRSLDRWAVRVGGGRNHRFGLSDAVLIKENHAALAGGVAQAARTALAQAPAGVTVEVECRSLTEVAAALEAGATHILLDNMQPESIAEAVRRVQGRAVLEASGQVTLENVRRIAECGVDAISVGQITHSAPALDLGLELEPL